MEWKSAQLEKNRRYIIPERWLYIHYYDALNVLFRFENSLRVFVYSVMKTEYFDSWHKQTFDVNGSQKGISNLALTRIAQSENFGYLGYDVKCPVMFLTSGEMVELMTSNAYWQLFGPHFRGNKEIIKNKLYEIGKIRNAFAHFRPIALDDVEVIKQNSKHTLLGVEAYLIGLFSQHDRVPTNTPESWYKAVSTIGSDSVFIGLLYSHDEKWINIQLQFRSTIIDKRIYGQQFYSYRLTRLISPSVLTEYPNLTKFLICSTESVTYPTIDDKFDLRVSKTTNLIFRLDVFISHAEEITEELRQVVQKISEEVSLLTNDNLARGKLVDSVEASAYWSENAGNNGRWQFRYTDMACAYKSDDPFEYWGDIGLWGEDVIAAAPRYPWMPSKISEDDIPF